MVKRKSRKPVWIGLSPKQEKAANAEFRKLKKTHSPAVAKRLARGKAVGKTHQQSRGHKAGEHKQRITTAQIERGEAEGKLTDKQTIEVLRFYATEYNPTGYGEKERIQGEEYEAHWQEHGMRAFIAYRAMLRELKRMWVAGGKPYKPGLYGASEIQGFAASLGLDDEKWLFYH